MEGKTMRALTIISLVLMVVGAINWGLVGIFGFNLVSWIFGPMSFVSRLIYLLVGLAGIYGIGMLTTLSNSHEDVCVPGHENMAMQTH